jgi:thymidylate synthase
MKESIENKIMGQSNHEQEPETMEEALEVIGELKAKHENLKSMFRKFALVFTSIVGLAAILAAHKWNQHKDQDEKILNNLKAMKNITIDEQFISSSDEYFGSDRIDFVSGMKTTKFNEEPNKKIMQIDSLVEDIQNNIIK